MFSPASLRNRAPIGELLKEYLSHSSKSEPFRLLEISSGCGAHALYFSDLFQNVEWQPTEYNDKPIAKLTANIEKEKSGRINLLKPLKVDVTKPSLLPEEIKKFAGHYDFAFNSNMVHITPWSCSLGLFSVVSQVLKKGGLLFMYGPFAVNGSLTPQSNVDFDNTLKMTNAEWGIRDILDLEAVAASEGFSLENCHDLPANNKILVWKRL